MRSDLVVTLVLGFGTLISHGFGLALIPAMLPRIAADLGTGYDTLGLVVAVGLVAYAGGALSAGRLADRVPARRVLVATHLIAGAGFVVAAVAQAAPSLALASAMLGFAAPVSWSVTLRIASLVVVATRQSAVMAGAASGAAVGVLINGVLVQTSGSVHSWRWSFGLAALLAALAGLATVGAIRVVASHEEPDGLRPGAAVARLLRSPAARVVVGASLVAGLAGFPFNVFLTATGIDEMRLSSWSVAGLWWLIGVIGTVAGPLIGGYADRTTASRALLIGWSAYALGLIVLLTDWGFTGLLVAAVGYSLMNYPIWGLVGAIASSHFTPSGAVRVVAMGLIGASLGGAAGNAAAGAWIEATGSFRGPVVVMGVLAAATFVWLWRLERSGAIGRRAPVADLS